MINRRGVVAAVPAALAARHPDGGKVEGPQIRGQLIAGGFDWNLSRTDGASVIEASYYRRTDDGVTIRITNIASAEETARAVAARPPLAPRRC